MSYNEDKLNDLKDQLAKNEERARHLRDMASKARGANIRGKSRAEKDAKIFEKQAEALENHIQWLRKEISIFEQQVKEEKQSSGINNDVGPSGSSAGQQMPGYDPSRPETRSNPVPPPGYSMSDLVRTPYGWAVKYDKTKRPPNLPPVASQERFADYQAEIMQQKGSQNMQLPSISSKQPMPSIGGNTNPGFARPPSNVVGGSVMTRWVNTKTGQTYTAPNAAWVPPSSDWVKVGPTPMFDKPKRQKQGPLLPPPTRGPSGLTPTNIPGLRR